LGVLPFERGKFAAALFELVVLFAKLREPLLMLRGEFALLALPLLFALREFAAQLFELLRFVVELRSATREIVVAARRLRAVLRQFGGQQLHLVGEGRFDAQNALAFRLQQLPGALSMSFQRARKLIAPHIGVDNFAILFFQGAHKPNLSSEDPTQRSSGVSAVHTGRARCPKFGRKCLLHLYVAGGARSKNDLVEMSSWSISASDCERL
jgi:hypothetical protein